ncbi:uncharacterized protein AKAME5_002868300 [Lates japonicus]|uniref:Uncharacterized protein n=1 Tax=Lates japonicus TaxID=270547 RepID=A0AAD3R6J4_LATJO|nr:uncharacterized protein AKAME5_002868300 [Lates japonicus]
MVDGSGEDDISMDSFKRNGVDTVKREHGCFRSLFEAERCPAPFMYGSQFYCFHCPGTEPVPGSGVKYRQNIGLDKPVEVTLLQPTTLCSHTERAEGGHIEGDSEGEEKLAMMYERLRIERPVMTIISRSSSSCSIITSGEKSIAPGARAIARSHGFDEEEALQTGGSQYVSRLKHG